MRAARRWRGCCAPATPLLTAPRPRSRSLSRRSSSSRSMSSPIFRPRSLCASTPPVPPRISARQRRTRRSGFWSGSTCSRRCRPAILSLPESAWSPALTQDGEQRDGAQVTEITELIDLKPWPKNSRVIIRRERPHPGAQLTFTDHDGHRFQATLTDLTGDAVEIERLHRGRANAEDRIRAAKQTGLDNLPFREFDLNAVWMELSLIAQDLIAWTQRLALDGELAICEPKALRYRLLHTAGRLAFHARRAILRLQASWPWAPQLAAAFQRLQALPPPAG